MSDLGILIGKAKAALADVETFVTTKVEPIAGAGLKAGLAVIETVLITDAPELADQALAILFGLATGGEVGAAAAAVKAGAADAPQAVAAVKNALQAGATAADAAVAKQSAAPTA